MPGIASPGIIASGQRVITGGGAARYWRVVALTGAGDYMQIPEIVFAATPGGANLCVGGTASASSGGGGLGPSNAVDGNLTTKWEAATRHNSQSWWAYDFGAPVRPVEIRIGTGSSTPAMTMRSFLLQRSDDGSTWISVDIFIGAAPSANTYRTFSVDPAKVLPTDEIRAWRINVTLAGGEMIIAELVFAATAGGANLSLGKQVMAGAGALSYPAANMADGNAATIYAPNSFTSNNWPNGTCGILFPSHQDAVELRLQAGSGYQAYAPKNFTIDKSYDGFNWTTMRTLTGITWTSGQIRTWSIP